MPMDITVTMARDLPMLSPDMVTMDMDMVTMDMVTGMVTGMVMVMEVIEVITMARDLPMLSPDMVTMDMDMEDTEEVIMVMGMVMVMDTTVKKFQKFTLIQSD